MDRKELPDRRSRELLVSRGRERKHSSEVLAVYLKISPCTFVGSQDTLLTVHAYWAIPRHECRHRLSAQCLTSLSRSLRSHRARASRAHPITRIQIVSDFQRDSPVQCKLGFGTSPFRPALPWKMLSLTRRNKSRVYLSTTEIHWLGTFTDTDDNDDNVYGKPWFENKTV